MYILFFMAFLTQNNVTLLAGVIIQLGKGSKKKKKKSGIFQIWSEATHPTLVIAENLEKKIKFLLF